MCCVVAKPVKNKPKKLLVNYSHKMAISESRLAEIWKSSLPFKVFKIFY